MAMHAGRAPRRYVSALREANARRTRDRILDALVRTLARGVAEVSIPAVATEAGVSVPTVYRHFPTKRALVAALPAHVEARVGLGDVTPPRDAEELADLLREVFVRVDGMDAELRAAQASALGREVRRTAELPARHRMFAEALAPATAALPPEERRHLLNVVAVLASGHALQAFKEDLGLSATEAAESAGWAIRTLARLAECLDTTDRRSQEEDDDHGDG